MVSQAIAPRPARSAIPLDANPLQADALSALADLLEDRHYSPYMTSAILRYVATQGTLAGSGIEAEDEADAEVVFVGNLPELDPASDAWDREDFLFDVEMLAAGNHPWPMPTVGDDNRTEPSAGLFPFGRSGLWDIPPVRGGSDEADAFEPNAQDRADYAQWAAELDARRDAEDFYRRHPISEFNAIRTD